MTITTASKLIAAEAKLEMLQKQYDILISRIEKLTEEKTDLKQDLITMEARYYDLEDELIDLEKKTETKKWYKKYLGL
jgi:uncharacterized protein (UPF0335 family)